MSRWHAQLDICYSHENARTVARFSHKGPLRVLQSLYPEGDAVCHNVLVHPPGGLVGGDTLDIQIELAANAHGLVTTPGATRFYRSEHGLATQNVRAKIADHARLEWLPLETLAYNACHGLNHTVFDLAPTAEMMAWDLTALGLPHAHQPFEQGQLQQHMEVRGLWLERGRLQAQDQRLLNSAVGLAGHRCLGTFIFASGSALTSDRRNAALEAARELVAQSPPELLAGVTAPNDQMLVLRTLSAVTEPAQNLLRSVWTVWRHHLWQMSAQAPRIWAM